MRLTSFWALLAALLTCSLLTAAQSLGDIAREARKNKPVKPSTHVYDNDNLPGRGTINVVGRGQSPTKPATAEAEPSASGLTPLSPSELAEDWRKRIAVQKQRVSDLEQELAPLEKEYRRLENECRWKECRVFVDISTGWAAYYDDPQDKAYSTAKEKVDASERSWRRRDRSSKL